MQITAIETIQLPEYPRNVWVLVHTDAGITGTGETFDKPDPIRGAIHGVCADLLLGQDPRRIEQHWQTLFSHIHYHGYAGAEFRAVSALDMALWDILGQVAGLPVYALLGGAVRDRLKLYNTCISFREFRDRERFLSEPGKLAEDLLAQGITAMKVWPFDDLSAPSGGHAITDAELAPGLRVIREIREAVGDRMQIAVEGHCRWNLTSSIRLARALEPYSVMWLEDVMIADNAGALAELRRSTTVPICGSERLFTRYGFLPLLQAGALDVVMPDVAWTGGISELRRIASLAEVYQLPVAPHNPGGPVAMAAGVHVMATTPNFMILESVRAFYQYYHELVEGDLVIRDGHVQVPSGPGLGVRLRPEVLARNDVLRQRSDGSTRTYGFAPAGDPWQRELPRG